MREPKTVASLILTQMFARIPTEIERERWEVSVTAGQLAGLVQLLEAGKLNRNLVKRIFPLMLERGADAETVLQAEGISTDDEVDIDALCRAAIESCAAAAADYRAGKEKGAAVDHRRGDEGLQRPCRRRRRAGKTDRLLR